MCFRQIKNLGKSIKESGVVPSTGREQKTMFTTLLGSQTNAFFVFCFYKQKKMEMEGSDLQFFSCPINRYVMSAVGDCHPETDHARA